MDTRLDTLSIKLYQVNICVGCITRRQATMGGFSFEATPSPPLPVASDFEDEDNNDGDDDDDDRDASFTDEMPTWYSYPLSLVTKKGNRVGWI